MRREWSWNYKIQVLFYLHKIAFQPMQWINKHIKMDNKIFFVVFIVYFLWPFALNTKRTKWNMSYKRTGTVTFQTRLHLQFFTFARFPAVGWCRVVTCAWTGLCTITTCFATGRPLLPRRPLSARLCWKTGDAYNYHRATRNFSWKIKYFMSTSFLFLPADLEHV